MGRVIPFPGRPGMRKAAPPIPTVAELIARRDRALLEVARCEAFLRMKNEIPPARSAVGSDAPGSPPCNEGDPREPA